MASPDLPSIAAAAPRFAQAKASEGLAAVARWYAAYAPALSPAAARRLPSETARTAAAAGSVDGGEDTVSVCVAVWVEVGGCVDCVPVTVMSVPDVSVITGGF